MPLGPVVRRLFGPYEHGLTEAYRGFFIDLDEFASLMHAWVPGAQRILEVGCGEGAMTERITRTYPNASVMAIDITPQVGRLYRGPTSNVTFSQENAEDVAKREPAAFDLVILADVIHHVPESERGDLLRAIRRCLVPGGSFIFKEWVRTRTPIHLLTWTIERYITGDHVSYGSEREMASLAEEFFGCPASRAQIRTWSNNVVLRYGVTKA